MKIWFCEGCGKRITDADLSAGEAKDKQLKGMYCKNCEQNTTTQPFEALRDVVVKSESPRVTQPKPVQARHSVRDTVPAQRKRPISPAVGIVVVISLCLLVAVLFIKPGPSNSTASNTVPKATNSSETRETNPVIASHVESERPQRSATPEKTASEGHAHLPPESSPAETEIPPKAIPDSTESAQEKLASDAFDRLTATLNGIPVADKERRVQEINAWLAQYGDSIVAGRARKMLRELNDPPGKAPANRLSSEGEAVTAVTAPKASSVNGNLFNGKDLTGIKFVAGANAELIKVQDGCLCFDSSFEGRVYWDIPNENYTVELELMIEKSEKPHPGMFFNIWTSAGRAFLLRSATEEWMTIRINVANGKMATRTINGDPKLVPNPTSSKAGQLSFYVKGGCWKKIRVLRLVDEP